MSEWRQPHRVWVVGHRGAPRRARENTVDSLDWAETLGADAVEFDLRQTRDGEAVLYHDEEIALGTQRIPIKSFTARELERFVIGSEFGEYRIPRLDQVFHRYGRALRYVVEVKTSPGMQLSLMARRVAVLASEYRVLDRCLVASFDTELLKKIREIAPEIATSFLFERPVALPEPGRPTPIFPPVDAIGPRHDLVTPGLLEHAAIAGLSVHPWTVDEVNEMERLFACGVASVTTNAPDVAVRVRDGAGGAEKGIAVRSAQGG